MLHLTLMSKRDYQKGDQGGYKYLKKYWDKHGWKPREIAYLIKHFHNKSDLEMSRGFLKKRSRTAILSMRHRLGLFKEPKNQKIWSDEEEAILKDNWIEYDQNELHDKFLPNKTPQQIRRKKMDMGLKGKKYVWSEEEIEVLSQVGPHRKNQFIIKNYLPNKTTRQISDARKFYCIKYNGP